MCCRFIIGPIGLTDRAPLPPKSCVRPPRGLRQSGTRTWSTTTRPTHTGPRRPAPTPTPPGPAVYPPTAPTAEEHEPDAPWAARDVASRSSSAGSPRSARRSSPSWPRSRRSCCCCRRSSSSPRRARWRVSIAAYTTIWGYAFASGFVVLLLVHEMGHVIRCGARASARRRPMFIPFLGAVVAAKSLGDNALARGARRASPAPILGTVGCRRLPGHLADHRPRLLAGARLHRLLPQPVQPAAGGAARRRARDGGDVALDVVPRVRRDRRAGVRVPQPDHPHHRAVRRRTRPTGAGSTAGTGTP